MLQDPLSDHNSTLRNNDSVRLSQKCRLCWNLYSNHQDHPLNKSYITNPSQYTKGIFAEINGTSTKVLTDSLHSILVDTFRNYFYPILQDPRQTTTMFTIPKSELYRHISFRLLHIAQ